MTFLRSHRQTGKRRLWLHCLLVCVLFRALIPVGFMAGSSQAGAAWDLISLCWGNSGSQKLLQLAGADIHSAGDTDSAQHSHPHHKPALDSDHSHDNQDVSQQHSQHSTDHQQADHAYCLYAGTVFNGLQPSAVTIALPLSAVSPLTLARTSHRAAPRAIIPPVRGPPTTPPTA